MSTKKHPVQRPDGLQPIITDVDALRATVDSLSAAIDRDGHIGSGITVARNIGIKAAIESLQAYAYAEQSETVIGHVFEQSHFYTAAWALQTVLGRDYGVDFAVPKPGMFGDEPPRQYTFPLSPTEMGTVTIGQFKVGLLTVETAFTRGDDGQAYMSISIATANNNKAAAEKLIALVEAEPNPWIGQTLVFEGDREPRDVIIVEPSLAREMIALNPNEDAALSLFLNQIDNFNLLKANNIPFKRGVLLYGPWGTGKTLAAAVFMHACRRAGITVIHERTLTTSSILKSMKLAATMEPALVFFEDIDLVPSRELINLLDDANSKDRNVSIVATTNHADELEPALTRTGRFDIVIKFGSPEPETRRKILAIHGCHEWDEAIETVTDEMVGSDLAEVARRATISSLIKGQETPNAEDILGGATTIARPPAQKDMVNHVNEALKQLFEKGNPLSRISQQIDYLYSNCD